MTIRKTTLVALLCALVLTGCAKGSKTLTPIQQIDQLQATADVISAQIRLGLGFAEQLATMPQFASIARFKDELALGRDALTELQAASQPFFDLVRAAQIDKAALRDSFAKIEEAVKKVRPHVDALVSLLAEYLKAQGKNVNIERIQLGIMAARMIFDGAAQVIPDLIGRLK